MKFGTDHKVDIKTLNEEEARDFLVFLRGELKRHRDEREKSFEMSNRLIFRPLGRFWFSQALRHEEDIIDIEKLIADVESKYCGG